MNELRDVFTKYKAVVFFDTETTGLEAESCQIIELAAIRVEKTERGTLRMADSADVFVKLPEGERIPQKIVELTGITDEQLKNEGITEAEAAARFTELISGGRVLLVAHNAQFPANEHQDLRRTAAAFQTAGGTGSPQRSADPHSQELPPSLLLPLLKWRPPFCTFSFLSPDLFPRSQKFHNYKTRRTGPSFQPCHALLILFCVYSLLVMFGIIIGARPW